MIANGRLISSIWAGGLIAASTLLAACGGGGSNAPAARTAAASPRSPDASITLTIVPSHVIRSTHLHGIKRKAAAASKSRRPLFVDPFGSTISLQFNPYNPNGNSAPSTSAGPIPIASSGPTVVTVPVYSGLGFAYGTEVYNAGSGSQPVVLASNQINEPFYQIDPGTNAPVSVTLSLVPAYLFLTTDQTISTDNGEVNNACFIVGNQNQHQTFTLVPADAQYDYAQTLAASMQTPPPSGLNGTVTLSNIVGSSDAGGSSTIVATGATWNGYTVYQFNYTPVGNGDQFAPPVTATATTVNPDGGYDYLDGVFDPPGNNGSTFTENVTITPNNNCG